MGLWDCGWGRGVRELTHFFSFLSFPAPSLFFFLSFLSLHYGAIVLF